MVCSITPERGSSREPPLYSFRSNFSSFHKARRIETETIIVASILMQERVKVKILENVRCTHSRIGEVHRNAELHTCQLCIPSVRVQIRTMLVSSMLNAFCGSGCGGAIGGAETAAGAAWPFVAFC